MQATTVLQQGGIFKHSLARIANECQRSIRSSHANRVGRKYESTPCYSTTLYSKLDVDRAPQRKPLSTKYAAKQSQPDVLIFIIESLYQDGFEKQMALTRSGLDRHGVTWFDSLHHRMGATRRNVPGLLWGKVPSHELNMTRTLLGGGWNFSAVFNISKQELQASALWNVAAENGYHTLYGCTACNILMGLHHAETNDGHVFHDTHQNLSDFQFSFPPGKFFSSDRKQGCKDCSRTEDPHVSMGSLGSSIPWDQHPCHVFEEAKFPDDILRCEAGGPFHHKFLDYYDKFRSVNDVPIFTYAHIEEPHGNLLFWPLDHHISSFLERTCSSRNTLLVFMGDHGDVSGTPLGIVLPKSMKSHKHLLQSLSKSTITHDDLYVFLRKFLETRDVQASAYDLAKASAARTCENIENLAHCLCTGARPEGFNPQHEMLNMPYVQVAVSKVEINRGEDCDPFILQSHETIHSAAQQHLRLKFTNKAIFEAVFRNNEVHDLWQVTRYHGQIGCTPEGTHPKFCVCDHDRFIRDNSHILSAQ